MRWMCKSFFSGMLMAVILLCCVFPAAAEEIAGEYILTGETVEGPDGSYVCFPVLTGGDPAVCDAVNAAAAEKAILSEYIDMLRNMSAGGAGLRVSWRSNAAEDGTCPAILSILITADGKQPYDRPGQLNYTMTFDLSDGSPVTFDRLCSDEEGMNDFLDGYVWDELESELSDYMSNCFLSPVPTDCFWLDGQGDIVFCYQRDRFSFLSGAGGAFAIRYDEAEEWLDIGEGSVLSLALNHKSSPFVLSVIGQDLKETLAKYRCPLDSFYYVSGSAYLTEEPLLRGVYLLTDEDEKIVTGVMMLRGRLDDAVIGKSTAGSMNMKEPVPVSEDECESLLTVPGTCCITEKDGLTVTYYFDADEVLHGIAVCETCN